MHNKSQMQFRHLPPLDAFTRDDAVGLLITATGDLHIYFNGKSVQKVATGLPMNKPLWGVADVRGNCSKIKSEILSGKMDGVSV